jgi:hypothetical protein
MLAFALYLVLNEKKFLKQQLDEIFGMLFGASTGSTIGGERGAAADHSFRQMHSTPAPSAAALFCPCPVQLFASLHLTNQHD